MTCTWTAANLPVPFCPHFNREPLSPSYHNQQLTVTHLVHLASNQQSAKLPRRSCPGQFTTSVLLGCAHHNPAPILNLSHLIPELWSCCSSDSISWANYSIWHRYRAFLAAVLSRGTPKRSLIRFRAQRRVPTSALSPSSLFSFTFLEQGILHCNPSLVVLKSPGRLCFPCS